MDQDRAIAEASCSGASPRKTTVSLSHYHRSLCRVVAQRGVEGRTFGRRVVACIS
jgi:hypothetical protein